MREVELLLFGKFQRRICVRNPFQNFSRQSRETVASKSLKTTDNKNVLRKIITGDESSVYGYEHETKQHSPQCKLPSEPRPKKASQGLTIVKSIMIFFYYEGVLHHDRVCGDQTMNTKY